MRRLPLTLLVLAIAAGAVLAAPVTPEEEEVYTIRILMGGDDSEQTQKIHDLINEQSGPDIGIHYGIEWVPWSDFDTKVALYTTTGEDIDAFLHFYPYLSNYYRQGILEPLNPYISESATPNLLDVIPMEIWEGLAIDGNMSAIPAVSEYQGFYNSYTLRKDLREEFGMGPVETLADLEEYFQNIEDNYPNMIPVHAPGGQSGDYYALGRHLGQLFFAGPDYFNGGPAVVDAVTNKVSSFADTQWLRDYVDIKHRWFQSGWQNPDIGAPYDSNAEFVQGKVAAGYHQWINAWRLNSSQIPAGSDVVAEAVLLNPKDPGIRYYWANNLLLVPRASNNPGALITFLDWLFGDRDMYDMLYLGEKGVNWDLDSSGGLITPSANSAAENAYSAHWWHQQAGLEYPSPEWDSETRNIMETIRDIDAPVVLSPALGFFMDTTPVESEATLILEAWERYGTPMTQGLVDPDDPKLGIAKLQEAWDDAGIDVYLAEAQRQWDTFIATK